MSRLIIAIVVGIVIAVGAVAVVENVLSTASNGTPSNASLYQYGTRLPTASAQRRSRASASGDGSAENAGEVPALVTDMC